jgi:type I restriction enzyme S subunit
LCDGKYGVKAGPFGSSLKKECYTTSGYRVYGQEQVIAGDFTIGDYYISKEKFEALRACEVKAGDVLISLVGTFGKVVVVPDGIEPGIINPRLLKISPKKKKVDSVFLATLLQQASVQSLLLQMSHGGTMGILNAGLLKQLRVPLPPVRLQREFAERVAEVRALETAQAQSRQRLEALFASLLDRAFQGEL